MNIQDDYLDMKISEVYLQIAEIKELIYKPLTTKQSSKIDKVRFELETIVNNAKNYKWWSLVNVNKNSNLNQEVYHENV